VRSRNGMMDGPPPGGGAGGPPPGGGAGGPPPGGGGFGGGGHGGPGGPPPGMGRGPDANGQRYPGRWNISVYHTVQLENRVMLTKGGPVLNLLSGDALTSGGVARHSLETEAGMFFSGAGLRLSGTWTAPTHVAASGVPGSSDLRYGALLKLNARVFVDLGQQKTLVQQSPFFKGSRVQIVANNIFDQIQKVTDGTGTTPIAYQTAYMDPVGRTVAVEFRKMF
jgi:iron complex outermembrane recepter protein